MTDVLTILFAAVLVVIMTAQLRRRAGHYEFPFLAAAVFAGFILAQVIGLRNDSGLPEGSLNKVAIMSILCVWACYAGFKWGAGRPRFVNWAFDENKFLQAAFALVAIGALFSILITRLPKEETEVSQWTGRPVAYLFFARCFPFGFAMALLLFLSTKRKAALVPILVGAFLYVDLAVVGVRRAEAVEFFLIILLALWYVRKRAIPKLTFLLFIGVGVMGMYSAGEVRSLIRGDKQFTSMLAGDFLAANASSKTVSPLENTGDVLKHGGAEVRNAAYLMAGVEDSLAFDFGMNDWNAMVFTWVPAQLVGREIKEALMIPLNSPMATGRSDGYEAPTGTTFCGIADAFGSFWYFGFVKFLAIGWILGVLNGAAIKGNWAAAILSMVLITDGLMAITHNTDVFLTGVLRAGVFVMPALWYAKSGTARSVAVRNKSGTRGSQRPQLPFRPKPRFPGAMARLRAL